MLSRGRGDDTQPGQYDDNTILGYCHGLFCLREAVCFHQDLHTSLRVCTVGKPGSARDICAGRKLSALKLVAVSIGDLDGFLGEVSGRPDKDSGVWHRLAGLVSHVNGEIARRGESEEPKNLGTSRKARTANARTKRAMATPLTGNSDLSSPGGRAEMAQFSSASAIAAALRKRLAGSLCIAFMTRRTMSSGRSGRSLSGGGMCPSTMACRILKSEAVSANGNLAGQGLVHCHAERVDISPVIHIGKAIQLLRRRIVERSPCQDRAGVRRRVPDALPGRSP